MLERFLFTRLWKSQLALTLVLAGILWLVQALNLFDRTLNAGASPLATLGISFLILPRIITYTLAPALLITAITQMVRLMQDNEYFAMTAAGFSPVRILRPIALLACLTMILQGALAFYISPVAMKQLKHQIERHKATFVISELQSGAFKDIAQGITIYTSGRSADDKWQDVMVYDITGAQPITYTAHQATFVANEGNSYLILENGTQQSVDKENQNQLVRFREFALPLTKPTPARASGRLNRNHMMIHQLLNPTAHGVSDKQRVMRMKARGIELIANLVTPFIFMLISFAVITGSGINRQGYARRVMLTVGVAILFQIGIMLLAPKAIALGQSGLLFVWPMVFFIGLAGFIAAQNNPALLRRTS